MGVTNTLAKHVGLIVLLLMTLLGCEIESTSNAQFYVEPSKRSTIVPTKSLRQGHALEVTIVSMLDTEELKLFRCGDECNSAFHVRTWSDCCFPEIDTSFHRIEQNGEYYMWILRRHMDGSAGPSFVETVDTVGE